MALLAFDEAGRPAPSFGGGRVAISTLPDAVETFTGLAVTAAGAVYLVTSAEWTTIESIDAGFVVRRLTGSGAIDREFGADGHAVERQPTEEGYSTARPEFVRAAVTTPDGRLVLGGGQSVRRYTLGGQIDRGFGKDGELRSVAGHLDDMEIGSDGRIVLAGSWRDEQVMLWVARYVADPTQDELPMLLLSRDDSAVQANPVPGLSIALPASVRARRGRSTTIAVVVRCRVTLRAGCRFVLRARDGKRLAAQRAVKLARGARRTVRLRIRRVRARSVVLSIRVGSGRKARWVRVGVVRVVLPT